ncbi:MAG: GNAT family N-acetyltransferase [Proteobacteria bacterium]|nr:GNAT family N-acetyltransferase [Pseudomonadota bacterium]
MSATRFSAEWRDIRTLTEQREAWQHLADNALEPNPFYGLSFLSALQGNLSPEHPIRVIMVCDGQGRLAGLFPVERPFFADGLLGRAWRMLGGPYLPLSTPLIAREAPEAVIIAALDLLAKSPGPDLLLFGFLPENRPVAHHLGRVLAARGAQSRILRRIARAAVETELDLATYRARLWPPRQNKDHAALARRYAALGTLTSRRIGPDAADFPDRLADFLVLEAKGWKGEAGTALASDPNRRAFAEAAFAGPDASLAMLELNAKPIAMSLDLVSQGAGYCFKTAYDPDFSRLAPGRYLDGEIVAHGAGGPLQRLDSCAGPGHPVERSWREREEIVALLASVTESGKQPSLGPVAWRFRLRAEISRLMHPKGYTTRKG